MGKFSKAFVVLALVLGLAGTAVAKTSVTIDLDRITPEQAAQVMAAKKGIQGAASKVASIDIPKAADKVESVIASIDGVKIQAWSSAIAEGIKTVCNTLSVEVNEFIKTPVGMGVAGLLAWKIAGDEIAEVIVWFKNLVISTTLYLFVIIVIGWNYKRKRGFNKSKNKETGEVSYTPKHVWTDHRIEGVRVETWSTVWHTVFFSLSTLIFIVLI